MDKEKKEIRQRVKPEIVLPVKAENELMKFLIEALPHKNRNNIKSFLTGNQVEVDGKIVTKYNHLLKPGNVVRIVWQRSPVVTKSFKGFTIVFEDEHLIVIDKHSGVLSVATKGERDYTAYNFLSKHVKREGPDKKIFVVHRLDRETSGLMVFAKSANVQHLMQDNWKDVVTERAYLAIVEGVIDENEGTVESYLHENGVFVVYSDQNSEGGKKAITNFKVLKRTKEYTLLMVRLDTGRKNQIRVHMQDIGHPIINDKKYGATQNPIDRLGLHAKVLAFTHPITGEKLRFETAMPRKFQRLF